MGRKKLEDGTQKVNINLRISPELKEELKEKKINSSKLFEEAAKFYLKQGNCRPHNKENKYF